MNVELLIRKEERTVTFLLEVGMDVLLIK